MASKAAVEMTWEDMAQVLVGTFPDLRESYEKLLAWWRDPQYAEDDDDPDDAPGNHVVYGDIFTPYLVRLLRGPREECGQLDMAFDFLEGMCLNKDNRVQEVAVVTVLEYIYGRAKLLALAKPHFGPSSLIALRHLDVFWKRVEEENR